MDIFAGKPKVNTGKQPKSQDSALCHYRDAANGHRVEPVVKHPKYDDVTAGMCVCMWL